MLGRHRPLFPFLDDELDTISEGSNEWIEEELNDNESPIKEDVNTKDKKSKNQNNFSRQKIVQEYLIFKGLANIPMRSKSKFAKNSNGKNNKNLENKIAKIGQAQLAERIENKLYPNYGIKKEEEKELKMKSEAAIAEAKKEVERAKWELECHLKTFHNGRTNEGEQLYLLNLPLAVEKSENQASEKIKKNRIIKNKQQQQRGLLVTGLEMVVWMDAQKRLEIAKKQLTEVEQLVEAKMEIMRTEVAIEKQQMDIGGMRNALKSKLKTSLKQWGDGKNKVENVFPYNLKNSIILSEDDLLELKNILAAREKEEKSRKMIAERAIQIGQNKVKRGYSCNGGGPSSSIYPSNLAASNSSSSAGTAEIIKNDNEFIIWVSDDELASLKRAESIVKVAKAYIKILKSNLKGKRIAQEEGN